MMYLIDKEKYELLGQFQKLKKESEQNEKS